MLIKQSVTYLLIGFIYLVSAQIIWQSEAMATTSTQNHDTQSLDESGCIDCHDGSKKIIVENPSAEEDEEQTRALLNIPQDKYAKGVHGDMTCMDCHKEITDSKASHEKNTTEKPNCIRCHENLWDLAKEQNLTKEKPDWESW